MVGALFALAAKGEVSWLPGGPHRGAGGVDERLPRLAVGRRGISIPARTSAKVKTLVQGIAILLCLAPSVAPHRDVLLGVAVWVAVALTVVTGAQYLLDGAARACARRAWDALMRVEILAVGTELLLGQIADTNSAWMGEQLALAGIDSHFHQAVGDNQARIVLALRTALARSDGVVVCGGLGPTHDDITRDAIAEVMNVALVRDPEIVERIAELFSSPRPGHAREQRPAGRRARRGHPHPAAAGHGARADLPGRPQGASTPLPGVPYEMAEMFSRAVLPDLRGRMAEAAASRRSSSSRVVRTWGMSESGLAELLGAAHRRASTPRRAPHHRLPGQRDRGDQGPHHRQGGRRRSEPCALLDAEEAEVRGAWWARPCSASTTPPWRRRVAAARCARGV